MALSDLAASASTSATSSASPACSAAAAHLVGSIPTDVVAVAPARTEQQARRDHGRDERAGERRHPAERNQWIFATTVPPMAPPARDHPLRAAPRFTPLGDGEEIGDLASTSAPSPGPATPRRRLRSALVGTGVGLVVALAAIAIAFSIVAIPLYLLASTDPDHGLDRDLVRQGLFYVALPFGVVAGAFTGLAVGIWYGRGGRLPEHRRGIYDN